MGSLMSSILTLYSTALSKIERATESDFDDVLTLLASGRLELSMLIGFFEEIVPRYATESLRQDPVEYRRKFEILKKMWQSRSSCFPALSQSPALSYPESNRQIAQRALDDKAAAAMPARPDRFRDRACPAA